MNTVLDASAVLALIYREPGAERVVDRLVGSVISAVNWSEVVQKLGQRGHPAPESAADAVRALGAHVAPFTAEHAVYAARLWEITRNAGLSLGDRACLAVAADIPDGVALTADRSWATVELDVPVELIR